MKFNYIAQFYCEDDGYWVKFSDIDGCYLQGNTIDEAAANAQEALQGHLEVLLKLGKKFIPPTHMNKINMEGISFASYVSCDVDLVNIKKVKKTLIIPAQQNDRAMELNINSSQIL